MHSCMCCHGRHVFHTVCIFCLALFWLLTWDFYFTRCVVQNLEYLLSLAYKPCPIWAISQGFSSVREGPIGMLLCAGPRMIYWWFHIWRFWMELLSGMRKLRVLLPNLVLRISTNIIGGLPLVFRLPCPFSRYWLVSFFWDRYDPVVPFW